MPLSDNDRDLMIRTIIGEAGDQSPEGQAAVAHVILNRAVTGQWGNSPGSVVLSPGQFEPWQTRSRELIRISPQSPQYQQVGQIVDAVSAGQIPDPTNGATHFLDPNIVKARRGGSLPDWAQGPNIAIGDHRFYAPNNPNYGDGGMAAISAAIGAAPNPGKSSVALAYTDTPSAAQSQPGSLFRDAGFDVPRKPAPAAAAPPPAPGSLFRDAGFTVPGQAPASPPPLPANAPPGAVSTVSIPGDPTPHYVDASGKFVNEAPPPASPVMDTVRSVLNLNPITHAADAAEAALYGGVEAARQGIQQIRQGNYWPSLGQGQQQPVTIHGLTGDYQTTQTTYPQAQAGGVLKTGLGVASAATSPITGLTSGLVEQPVSAMFGPDVGARAGLVANVLAGGEGAGSSGALVKTGTGAVASAAKDATPSGRALTTLVDTIGPENVPAAVMRLARNPRLALMDVSDPVRVAAQGLIDPAQPAAQNILTQAVKQRVATAPAAVDEAYSTAMGPAPSVLQTVERLKQQAQAVGTKMIQPAIAGAKPVDLTPVISAIDQELKPGLQAIAQPGTGITLSPAQQELARIKGQLTDGTSVLTDPTKIHAIQTNLRAEAQNLLSSSSGADRNMGTKLMGVRNQIVDAIDAASPQVLKQTSTDFLRAQPNVPAWALNAPQAAQDKMAAALGWSAETTGTYKPALAKYRDAKMVDEAFKDGFDVTKNRPGFVGATEDSPEAMAQWLLSASPEEIAAKQLGARASIAHDMGRTRFAARVGSDIPQVDYNAQKLRMLFGPQEGNRLLQSMNDIRDEAATNSKMIQGSKTAETLAGREALKVPQVEPFKLGSLTGALLPTAAAEIAAEYSGIPPGLAGAGMFASGIAAGTLRKGAQSFARQAALSRNASFARMASATGQQREGVLTALATHPKVIRALQKPQNALAAP